MASEEWAKYNAGTHSARVLRETLSLFHPVFGQGRHITNHSEPFEGIVRGQTVTFLQQPFRVREPEHTANERFEMGVDMAVTGPAFIEEMEAIARSGESIEIEFNGYFKAGEASEQTLVLYLSGFAEQNGTVSGTATWVDIFNMLYPRAIFGSPEYFLPGLVR